jgi:hypothetical protein
MAIDIGKFDGQYRRMEHATGADHSGHAPTKW